MSKRARRLVLGIRKMKHDDESFEPSDSVLHVDEHADYSDFDEHDPNEYRGFYEESPVRRWVRRILFGAITLTSLVAVSIACAYWLSQREPEFYQKALQQPLEIATEKGAELETSVLDLYNSVLQAERWRGAATEEQINGWLAVELPAKFPELLPAQVLADPRISIEMDEISFAGRTHFRGLKGIAVARLNLFKTDQPNQFAIHFRSVYIGVVPIPIKSCAEQIDQVLQQRGYQTQWFDREDGPLMTVTVPEDYLVVQDLYRLNVETLDLEDGQIVVSGTTVNVIDEEAEK